MENKLTSYKCYIFYYIDKEFKQISNTACFLGLKNKFNTSTYLYLKLEVKLNKGDLRILQLINNITPCKLVTINNEKYIKYKTIFSSNYYANLVLLDFLRIIWYDQAGFLDYNKFYSYITPIRRGKDSLELLLEAINYSFGDKCSYSMGHSILVKGIIPKTKKQLLEYNWSNAGSRDSWLKIHI